MKKRIAIILAFALSLSLPATFSACEKKRSPFVRYELVCEYRPEDAAVTGALKVEFENPTEQPLEVLKFYLYPNAYRKNALFPAVLENAYDEVYYSGVDYGSIAVTSVLGAKGWEIAGEDENILEASLETPLYPKEKVVLDVGFTTRLARAKHRLGVTEEGVNLGWFYPVLCAVTETGFSETVCSSIGDPFFADAADYLVNFTLPKEYALVCGGERLEEKTLESKKRHTVSLTNAREFAAVLSTGYEVKSARVGKTTVEYCYLSDPTPEKTLRLAEEALGFYSAVFGEYPYFSYTLAETSLSCGGQEYSSFSVIRTELSEEERARCVAHELAHQWWYAAVGNDQTLSAWQDEGLAEFSAALFFEKYGDYGLTKKGIVEAARKNYLAYGRTYRQALGWVDLRMTRSLAEYLSEYEYKSVCFDKAVVMFDALCQSLGEKKFFAGLKKYYVENKYGVASAGDLIGAFERVGVDATGFFEGFLNGKEIL